MKNTLDEQIRHKGAVITRKQFVDSLIADGYTTLKSRQSGAVKRHSLWNDKNHGFDIIPAERKYATRLLEAVNEEPKVSELQQFFNAVKEEETRVHEVLQLHTLSGAQNAQKIWENHFQDKYTHGVNVKYDIARVNVLRRQAAKEVLC